MMFKLRSTLLTFISSCWTVDCRRNCRTSIKVQGVTDSGIQCLHQTNTLVESLTKDSDVELIQELLQINLRTFLDPWSLTTLSLFRSDWIDSASCLTYKTNWSDFFSSYRIKHTSPRIAEKQSIQPPMSETSIFWLSRRA